MPTLTRNGVPIHYLDAGRGLPVLLLHAFPVHGALFQPQIQALSGEYRLVIPDHRGFGQSGLGSGPTEMSTLALDSLAVLDALGIGSAVVAGVSMGGYAAMALLRHDPGRVKALVLIDTRATADSEAGKQERERTAQATLRGGMQVLADSMLPKLLAPQAKQEVRGQVERMIRENRPEGAAAALRGMALRTDSSDILARFGAPALVVVGEHDVLTTRDDAERMKALMPASRLVVIPGAGHLSNLENAAAFNQALKGFLGPVSAVG